MDRRDFLKDTAGTLAALTALSPLLEAGPPARPDLAVVRGTSPERIVRAAVDALGGIRRFIAKGDVVVVRPNIGWDRRPEQAATTNPEVVATLVKLCFEAGARKVKVFDRTCNDPRRCFERSGIAEAARRAGAEIILPDPARFKDVNLEGSVLSNWPVFDPFLNADKIINIPIAKHHSLSGTTLGMKNWYGILGGPRHQLHQKIHESLVALADFVRPTLTMIAQEDDGGRHRSSGARRLRRQSLLESGRLSAALSANGSEARLGNV